MSLAPRTFARSLMTAGITAALGFTTLPAMAAADHAHQHGNAAVAAPNAKAAEARQKAFDHTHGLMAMQKQWAKTKGAEKSRALEQLVAKAEARRAYLLELMESDPAAVLSAAIPDDKQVGMPAEVLEKLEQKVQLEGELEVIQVDTEDFSESHLRHQLKTPFGDRFALHIGGKRPNMQTGDEISVNGVLFENTDEDGEGAIVLDSNQDGILMLALGGDPVAGEPGPVSNTFGVQKTLVILLNFQDNTAQPWSKSEVSSLMNGQISDFILENSYGQTSIQADVAGYFTLPYSSSTCSDIDYTQWADQAAAAAGFSPSNYDRLVYAWPRSESCGYLGLGTVGGKPSRAKINGEFTFSTVTHELGHNFGLSHSHDMDCGTSVLGSSCSYTEYGDYPDIMGAGFAGHFNAFQKDRLGWLGYGNSPAITVVTQSGTYSIDAYEHQGPAPKALKILKSEDPNTGDKQWYYLESRQPLGFDSGINSNWMQNFTRGVGIRTGYKAYGSTSMLLDMTPSSIYGHSDGALEAGNSYTDNEAGISFTTNSVNSSGAQITVDLDGSGSTTPTCTRANPSLSVTPGQSSWVTAGTSVSYSVTLTNRDSSACSNSSFALTSTQPSGWSAAYASSSLTLAPGASKTTQLTVTSGSGATDGFYTIGLKAASGAYSASSSVTYVVDTPTAANSAPIAGNDSASTAQDTPVTINVLNNDRDPDGDALSISSVSGVNGKAVINSNGSLTFTPASGFSGTEQFAYTVTDGKGGSDSATVSVSVAAAPAGNSAPVAVNDTAQMDSISSITIPVLANDYDPEGTALKVSSVTQGSKGSVRVNTDGTLTYVPGKRFKTGDSFTYTITDGKLSASATVSVQLNSSTGDTTVSPGKGNGKGSQK